MANITRLDPITDLVDDLFKGFLVRPMYRGESEVRAAPRVRVDVAESNGAYVVIAEMPGVKKEDIQVTIDGAQVTFTAETRREENAKERILHSERAFGKLTRSLSLPQEIDAAKAQAKLRDGLLELSLPKKAENARKQIEIH